MARRGVPRSPQRLAPRPRVVTAPPALRATPVPPPRRGATRTPTAPTRVERPSRPPKPHAVGKPPNPRKPQMVRDVHGNELKDLFALFPDLPRPARPSARLPVRRSPIRR